MKKNKSVYSITSLVLGIISIFFSFFYYMVLPCGILAIVFGTKSIREYESKLGKAGLVTGIVGLSLFAFIYITAILLIVLQDML